MRAQINNANPYGTNCYYVLNEETGEALIIDPAGSLAQTRDFFEKNRFKPAAVLLTHGHFDHISLAADVKKAFDIPIYAGFFESQTLKEPSRNLSGSHGASISLTADFLLADGQRLVLAGFEIEVIFTPGHTPGGVCYYFPAEKACFTGDTLFKRDCGRCDLPGGSLNALKNSITQKLFAALPELTTVYPGHGALSTIGEEKKHNEILRY